MPDGRAHDFGSGTGAPWVTVRLLDEDLPRKVVLNPDLAVSEAYMDERLTIDGDDLHAFFEMILVNLSQRRSAWWQAPLALSRRAMRRLAQHNPIGRAQQNVAHHYDLSGALYDLFLDEDRQYSCAYFPRPGMTLDEAQAAKKAHIAKKLLLKPGMRVLDIGCGWGGMALTLAGEHGARVVGVTLSKEQHAVAVKRAEAAGLSDRVDFRLTDYRTLSESF
ncbi:MAG: SAM-dependent methyltransferase, partial [Pseudooceanicola nanhaiensis]